jgi:protein tyrosine phosphatase (PTP) superfamily phosphohydrolase (DUF442 family)
MQRRPITSLLIFTTVFLVNTAEGAPSEAPGAVASIVRFAQVDDRLYRGGQPGADGFRALRELGVRTVVSLRNETSERELVESLGMSYVHLPVTLRPLGMSGTVSPDAIARFFEIVDDPASGIVFVHCRHGKDRTGLFVSLYRIARHRWSVDDAYAEARRIGMAWWHFVTKGQMKAFASALRLPAAAVTSRFSPGPEPSLVER